MRKNRLSKLIRSSTIYKQNREVIVSNIKIQYANTKINMQHSNVKFKIKFGDTNVHSIEYYTKFEYLQNNF